MNKKSLPFILAFFALTVAAALIPLFNLDLTITRFVQDINSRIFAQVMWVISSIGNRPLMVFIVITVSLFLFLQGKKKEAVISSLSTVISVLSGSLLKIIIDRPRPSGDLVHVSVWLSDKSYPSNHVLAFTVFFGFLLYLLLKRSKKNIINTVIAIIFILLIASIGISRIYLGAHWATDVLGGYLLGIIWLIATIKFYNSRNGQR